MFHQYVIWLAKVIGQWGHSGIVLLMALESSFFPFPSEVVIPPAAYLAAAGKMNSALVILSCRKQQRKIGYEPYDFPLFVPLCPLA